MCNSPRQFLSCHFLFKPSFPLPVNGVVLYIIQTLIYSHSTTTERQLLGLSHALSLLCQRKQTGNEQVKCVIQTLFYILNTLLLLFEPLLYTWTREILKRCCISLMEYYPSVESQSSVFLCQAFMFHVTQTHTHTAVHTHIQINII